MAHPPPQGTRTPPGRDPARPPRDPAALRRAGRATTRFGLLALVTVLASGLPLPWGLAALAFGAAALAAGVVALVAAVRARVRAVAVVVLSVGLALVVLVFVGGLLQVAVYPLAVEYQECVAEAITAEAAPRCQQDLRRGLLDLAFGR